MANPQTEDGYVKISNELFKALGRINLSPYESRVLNCIIRKTYGFNKKKDWISLTQFAEYTGLDKRNISKALKKLSSKRMITANRENKRKVLYSLQKNYEKWGDVIHTDDNVIIQTDDTDGVCLDDKMVSIQTPTKDIIQKTNKNIKEKEQTLFGDSLQFIIDKWNSTVKSMGKIEVINGKRRKRFEQLIKQNGLIEKFWQAVPIADNLHSRGVNWLDFDIMIWKDRDDRWRVDCVLQGRYNGLVKDKPYVEDDEIQFGG